MKKTIAILLATMLALGVSGAFAETVPQGVNYVDENNDGICDLCGGTDADGDGVCDNCTNDGTRPMDGTGRRFGRGNGARGTRFVDANGDGVCDNMNGRGRGFVDANGDGICDNASMGGRGNGVTRGNGRGQRGR